MKSSLSIQYNTTVIDGLNVFYREAGPKDAPTIVLLHGFPSSSHMYRDLIASLQNDFHLIAPDYPGFGYSDSPAVDKFDYTFDKLAEVMTRFLEAKGCKRYWLFMQDYGGPIGYRIASAHPGRVAGLLIQNANAYMDGVSEMFADTAKPFWQNRTPASEAPLRGMSTPEGVRWQYVTGVRDTSRLSPDAWAHDLISLSRPGNAEVQMALLHNYQSNVARYLEWQGYFRTHRPPTLITWGSGDPFFTVDGARAYLRDLPEAELHLLDTGHFALEDHTDEIAAHVRAFIRQHSSQS